MTRRRRSIRPPAWIGRIGPGQRWRTEADFRDWVREVWLRQPFAVRVAKVTHWCQSWHHSQRRARA